jgi:metallo-beta-lactamase family protein
MQKIEFFGAASDEVTGSNYLLTATDGNQVLIDFGMFQGSPELEKKNYDLLGFEPSSLQGVFLTHAHLDHCGRLPLLIFGGFKEKIYMTAPTRAFVEIILSDSARIAEKDMTASPLYSMDEVEKVLRMIEIVEYDREIPVGSFTAVFRDAGHILGSSSIELSDNESKKKIVFSGDLGNTPQDLVKPTQYIEQADYVVMESTYGDSAHPDEDAKEIIQEEINKVEETGGVLLIPAFAIERTQELLHIIHHLKKDGKIRADTPVFLDSPMGINATEVYLDFQEFYNDEIKSHGEEIPFNFDGLVITDEARDSRAIIESPPPKVIVAGSGMMSGGRILHHAANYLSRETTRILFVGYQAEETIGRKVLEGAKNVVIDKKQIPVRAKIREIKILSSHADLPKLVKWVSHIQGVQKVFLTHGEVNQRQGLREKIKAETEIQEVFLPGDGESFELDG